MTNKTGMLITLVGLLFCLSNAGCWTTTATDGDYSILLMPVSGPDHVTRAKKIKEDTEKWTGWKPLFIITSDKDSAVYWGHYPNVDAAQSNLRKAKEFVPPDCQTKVFATAFIRMIPGRGTEHPEWDLANVDPCKNDPKYGKGYITLLIGVYYDEPDAVDEKGRSVPYFGYSSRRAVKVCEELRAKGYEAYYYFTSGRSLVSVGVFPPQSMEVKMVKNPNDAPGQDSRVKQCKIIDPRLAKLKTDFPDLAVNEHGIQTEGKNTKTGQIEMVRQESYFIRLREVKKNNAQFEADNFSDPELGQNH